MKQGLITIPPPRVMRAIAEQCNRLRAVCSTEDPILKFEGYADIFTAVVDREISETSLILTSFFSNPCDLRLLQDRFRAFCKARSDDLLRSSDFFLDRYPDGLVNQVCLKLFEILFEPKMLVEAFQVLCPQISSILQFHPIFQDNRLISIELIRVPVVDSSANSALEPGWNFGNFVFWQDCAFPMKAFEALAEYTGGFLEHHLMVYQVLLEQYPELCALIYSHNDSAEELKHDLEVYRTAGMTPLAAIEKLIRGLKRGGARQMGSEDVAGLAASQAVHDFECYLNNLGLRKDESEEQQLGDQVLGLSGSHHNLNISWILNTHLKKHGQCVETAAHYLENILQCNQKKALLHQSPPDAKEWLRQIKVKYMQSSLLSMAKLSGLRRLPLGIVSLVFKKIELTDFSELVVLLSCIPHDFYAVFLSMISQEDQVNDVESLDSADEDDVSYFKQLFELLRNDGPDPLLSVASRIAMIRALTEPGLILGLDIVDRWQVCSVAEYGADLPADLAQVKVHLEAQLISFLKMQLESKQTSRHLKKKYIHFLNEERSFLINFLRHIGSHAYVTFLESLTDLGIDLRSVFFENLILNLILIVSDDSPHLSSDEAQVLEALLVQSDTVLGLTILQRWHLMPPLDYYDTRIDSKIQKVRDKCKELVLLRLQEEWRGEFKDHQAKADYIKFCCANPKISIPLLQSMSPTDYQFFFDCHDVLLHLSAKSFLDAVTETLFTLRDGGFFSTEQRDALIRLLSGPNMVLGLYPFERWDSCALYREVNSKLNPNVLFSLKEHLQNTSPITSACIDFCCDYPQFLIDLLKDPQFDPCCLINPDIHSSSKYDFFSILSKILYENQERLLHVAGTLQSLLTRPDRVFGLNELERWERLEKISDSRFNRNLSNLNCRRLHASDLIFDGLDPITQMQRQLMPHLMIFLQNQITSDLIFEGCFSFYSDHPAFLYRVFEIIPDSLHKHFFDYLTTLSRRTSILFILLLQKVQDSSWSHADILFAQLTAPGEVLGLNFHERIELLKNYFSPDQFLRTLFAHCIHDANRAGLFFKNIIRSFEVKWDNTDPIFPGSSLQSPESIAVINCLLDRLHVTGLNFIEMWNIIQESAGMSSTVKDVLCETVWSKLNDADKMCIVMDFLDLLDVDGVGLMVGEARLESEVLYAAHIIDADPNRYQMPLEKFLSVLPSLQAQFFVEGKFELLLSIERKHELILELQSCYWAARTTKMEYFGLFKPGGRAQASQLMMAENSGYYCGFLYPGYT